MINKKQKNAIKSPYLGIFCRKERRDIVVIEGGDGEMGYLYYTSNKYFNHFNHNTNILLYTYYK